MFKQPRVPELRDGGNLYIAVKNLVLFLKDFCSDVWAAYQQLKKENDEIKKRLDALEGK